MAVSPEKSLETRYPNVAMQWDYDANYPLVPLNVSAYSAKKVHWKCSKEHRWEARIYNRTNGTGCPYCSGKLPIIGETDLATLFPHLIAEWDYSENYPVIPQNVTAHSRKKVSWKCVWGHTWKTSVANRANGSECPYCSGKLPIQGETDLTTCSPELASEWDYERNYPLTPNDVSMHSTTKVHWKCNHNHQWIAEINSRSKGRNCPYCAGTLPILGSTDLQSVFPDIAAEWDDEENGSLKPYEVTAHSDKKIHWKCQNGHKWVASINNRSKGKGCPYCANQVPVAGENDLQTIFPDLTKEWDYMRNNPDLPQNHTVFSHKQVWWQCEKGHSWKARIYNRASGNKCPYCAGKLPIVGSTDLATTHPQISLQWDYDKNKCLTPRNVMSHSRNHVWWNCELGHSWKAQIAQRVNGSNCPYCAGRLPIVGKTDLATMFPCVADQWDYQKNGKLTPRDVTSHSGKRVWWCCEQGHSWRTPISSRTNGSGCPTCSGRAKRK